MTQAGVGDVGQFYFCPPHLPTSEFINKSSLFISLPGDICWLKLKFIRTLLMF